MNFLNKINKQDKVQIYIDPNYSAIGWIDFIGKDYIIVRESAEGLTNKEVIIPIDKIKYVRPRK